MRGSDGGLDAASSGGGVGGAKAVVKLDPKTTSRLRKLDCRGTMSGPEWSVEKLAFTTCTQA